MSHRDSREYYLAFISIVFGIFIAVWAQPLIDVFKPERRPTENTAKLSKRTNTVVQVTGSNAVAQVSSNGIALTVTNAVDLANAPIPLSQRTQNTGLAQGHFSEVDVLELAQGGLTLLIIVCLWWWYGVFLREFSPAQGFVMYLYDFLSLGCFAIAAGIWRDRTGSFAMVVLFASVLVALRFYLSRKRTRRFPRARRALELGTWTVVVLVILGAVFNFGYGIGKEKGAPWIDDRTLSLFLIGVMLAGLGVTIAAVHLTEGIGWRRDFVLDESYDRLINPLLLPLPNWSPSDSAVIENRCRSAFREFEEKCIEFGLYSAGNITSSEVHSSHDLYCQAKLAIYSSDGTADSISKRVQMMYFVHWFDDFIDQRDPLAASLCNVTNISFEGLFAANRQLRGVQKLVDHYRALCKQSYFDAGLARVIFGGRIFKAKLDMLPRLRDRHKTFLTSQGVPVEWIDSEEPRLIDLSVKTVTEFWFGMERQTMPYDYSFLFSLLYGPGLYYHDSIEEAKAGELSVEWGELNANQAAELIRKVGRKIEDRIGEDPKAAHRAQEVFHFVLCFGDVVPSVIKSAYDDVAGDLLAAADHGSGNGSAAVPRAKTVTA